MGKEISQDIELCCLLLTEFNEMKQIQHRFTAHYSILVKCLRLNRRLFKQTILELMQKSINNAVKLGSLA